MGDYDDNIQQYREKKKTIIDTGSAEKTIKERVLQSPKAAEKERQRETYSKSYRQILATDFDSEEWIGRKTELRKHRKNINKNYKSLTGRKWGLSGEEKLKRKKGFDERRDLSIKASMALTAFIGDISGVDPDPEDEAVMKTLEEMDLSQFAYRTGGGTMSDLESDTAFVAGFAGQMKLLHGASILYGKLQTGGAAVSPALMMKLAQMNQMRQAYEDRIRIISSPYYVSLRDADFDKSAKKELKKKRDEDVTDEKKQNLRSYAKAMMRWKESGKILLAEKQAPAPAAPAEQVVKDDSVLSETKTYESDKVVDRVIDKVNGRIPKRFTKLVNGASDQGMAFTKKWVYGSLKSKPDAKDLVNETERMKTYLRNSLADPSIKETERRSKEKLLRHLDRVTSAFAAKRISEDVMRIWLDRCLQHKLNYSNEIYMSLVHQGFTATDEDRYFHNVTGVIDPYVKQMDGGVIFAQSTYKKEGEAGGVYQNEKDVDESKDPEKVRLRRRVKAKPFRGMGGMSQGDTGEFIHINGKNADPYDVSTRVYISAKPKYKSLVVKLFTEAVNEFKGKTMRDEIYFKISTDKSRGRGFAADDLTVYMGSNLTEEEKKQLLDSFYEKCKNAGDKLRNSDERENVLDGNNMAVAGVKYEDGIAIAGEPDIASIMNEHFANVEGDFKAKYSQRTKLDQMNSMSQDQCKPQYSFNTFVSAMLVQSTFVAGKRLGIKSTKEIDTNDPKVREETRRIFRQLCFLNGINPENMAEIDSKNMFG